MRPILCLVAILCGSSNVDAEGFDRELFDLWVAARAGTGTPVFWYSEGTVRTYPQGELLVRIEGFDAARVERPADDPNIAYQLSRKVYVYRDPRTNEILREFRGKPVAAIKFPYQHITYQLNGDRLETWVEQGAGKTYLKIGPGSDIQARRRGGSVVFTAPLFLDVEGPPGKRRTLFENYDFFIHENARDPRDRHQLSWLRYGDRDGLSDGPTVTHMVAWRVDRFEDLPSPIRQFVETEAKLWMQPPENKAEIQRLQQATPGT